MQITIDFWQTLYDTANGTERNEGRRSALFTAIAAENEAPDQERFDEVYRSVWGFFDEEWLGKQRTPSSEEMIAFMMRELDTSIGDDALASVVHVFEENIIAHPPHLMPHAAEALALLAEQGPLAIISDTAFSPGRVLRQVMERDGIADHFSAFSFSNETGVAKPNPKAFLYALEEIDGAPETALHIGDIERTDVKGARNVGMTAILYRNDEHRHAYVEEETEAERVLEAWNRAVEICLDNNANETDRASDGK